jgi:CDGSH iron-sulfur domain-containing protein 3
MLLVDIQNNSIILHIDCILARLVKKENKGPLEIKVGTKSVLICMCGLSSNQPFCDDSHKKTADEENNKTYAYEKEGDRIEVKNWEVVY